MQNNPKSFLYAIPLSVCKLANIKTETYDFLGSKLIMRESGCVITNFRGRPDNDDFNHTFVASGSSAIHKKILRLI